MGGNGSHSSGSGTGRDFPPVFSWDWDGTRFFSVGVGRERFENPLPCHPLMCGLGADIAIVANIKVTFDFTKKKQNITEI